MNQIWSGSRQSGLPEPTKALVGDRTHPATQRVDELAARKIALDSRSSKRVLTSFDKVAERGSRMSRTVHVPYTVEQDDDDIWCAHAQLRPGVGANGEGDSCETAITDLRE